MIRNAPVRQRMAVIRTWYFFCRAGIVILTIGQVYNRAGLKSSGSAAGAFGRPEILSEQE